MSKTIEALENDFWDEPTYPASFVLKTHELRKKPIDDFTIEDLRFMIGENEGTDILLPITLDRLKDSPLAKSYVYPEFLLFSVISLPKEYWETKKNELQSVKTIGNLALKELELTWKQRQSNLKREYNAEIDLKDCIEDPEDKLAELVKKFLENHK